jgi:hypothetical protein
MAPRSRRAKLSSRGSSGAPRSGDELARQIEDARRRVRPLVPDVDEQSLVTILSSLLRPFGTGKRFLLRRRPDGGFIV